MTKPLDKKLLPPDIEYGIHISALPQCKKSEGILVTGNYKVLYAEEGVPKQSTLIPKHLTLVVTRLGNYTATKPFYDMVVFEDDVKDDGQCASGRFNINIFNKIQFNCEGDYYMLFSLGSYLSNIVKVTVI